MSNRYESGSPATCSGEEVTVKIPGIMIIQESIKIDKNSPDEKLEIITPHLDYDIGILKEDILEHLKWRKDWIYNFK